MTTVQAEKIARRKLTLLQLAQELGNVSKACKIVGYSRQQFYEIRRNFQTYGAEGLLTGCPAPKVRTRTGSATRSNRRSWSTDSSTRRMAPSA